LHHQIYLFSASNTTGGAYSGPSGLRSAPPRQIPGCACVNTPASTRVLAMLLACMDAFVFIGAYGIRKTFSAA